MKKTLLIPLLLISLIPLSNAQNKWAGSSHYRQGAFNIKTYYNVYEECGDTIINTHHYKKILHSSYEEENGSGNLVKSHTGLFAITRQVNDSILYRRSSDSTDKLLYDFGVEIGDTVSLYLINKSGPVDFKVTDIDTVSVFGKNRKRIQIWDSDYIAGDTWIEGIGSIEQGYFARGFPYVQDIGVEFYFSCFYNADLDSSVSYGLLGKSGMCSTMGSVDLGCTETTSLSEKDFSPQFVLYPNPFSDYIQIGNEGVNGVAKIYNMIGQEVSSYPIENQPLKINTSSLSPGVYIISIQDDKGIILNKKMIKQN